MINQVKSNIPRQQRHWYTYDDPSKHDAVAIGYNYQTGIDTVHISIKLTYEQIGHLIQHYDYVPLYESGFTYMIHAEGITVLYGMIADNTYLNAQIQIQVKDLVYGQLYYDVMDFLKSDYHYICRLDFYIDYAIPRSRTITYKRHGNQSMDNYDTSNWIGDGNNTRKTVLVSNYIYSKCHKVKKLHDNRFEYKLFFTFKHNQKFNNIDQQLIADRLAKELLVLDYQSIPTFTNEEKALLTDSKKVKKVEIRGKTKQVDIIKQALNQSERTKLRRKVRQNRQPLEDIFLAAFPTLFDWLDDTTPPEIDLALLSTIDSDSAVIDELL